jgi:D-serine deaminase-like pyridoxal phosphate-dependent protein
MTFFGENVLFPELDTPEVLLDLAAMERNIARMADIARDAGLKLRPHTKTHKSPEIAKLQLRAGASGITVAKLGEAEVMVEYGIDDILIAYPIVGERKLERLARLHQKAKLIVSTDSVECAEGLHQVGESTGKPVEVYVEIDTGLGRCGHKPGRETIDVVKQMKRLSGIRVVGVMTHEGHSWTATESSKREEIIRETSSALADTAKELRALGLPCTEVSAGATPTAFHAKAATGATEMRPGTYIFNDVNVLTHGFITREDCAVTVLATVVGHPAKDRVILDVGSKTLSQDGAIDNDFKGVFVDKPRWHLVKLTEEHGIVHVPEGEKVVIGERVRIIPNHVCVVTNLVDQFVTVRGSEIVGTLKVEARGRTK